MLLALITPTLTSVDFEGVRVTLLITSPFNYTFVHLYMHCLNVSPSGKKKRKQKTSISDGNSLNLLFLTHLILCAFKNIIHGNLH